jgi:hypothetical protein
LRPKRGGLLLLDVVTRHPVRPSAGRMTGSSG